MFIQLDASHFSNPLEDPLVLPINYQRQPLAGSKNRDRVPMHEPGSIFDHMRFIGQNQDAQPHRNFNINPGVLSTNGAGTFINDTLYDREQLQSFENSYHDLDQLHNYSKHSNGTGGGLFNLSN